MVKIYATIENENKTLGKPFPMVRKGSNEFLLITLYSYSTKYAQIGWCKESNQVCIYGKDKQLITCFNAEDLGYI